MPGVKYTLNQKEDINLLFLHSCSINRNTLKKPLDFRSLDRKEIGSDKHEEKCGSIICIQIGKQEKEKTFL